VSAKSDVKRPSRKLRGSTPPNEERSVVRLLIVDDHMVVRRGLIDILRAGFPTAVFTEARDATEMLEKVRQRNWSAVITDVTMPGRSGIDALRELKQTQPAVPVLVMSMHGEDQYAVRALKAGASGYVTKDKAAEELVMALTRVLEGRKYVSTQLAERLAGELTAPAGHLPHEQLSEREFQVLCSLAKARTIKEIAAELSLSVKTVSTYHVRLLTKLGMTRDAELVRYAIDHRLVE